MNKKGFTLIELLGAIVILSLLALIAVPAVTKTVKDNKQKLYDTQLENIRSSAKAWGADNIDKLPDDGACIYFDLGTLKEAGLVENDIKDPRNSKLLEDSMFIKITGNGNSYDYEVNVENIEGCVLVQ